MLFKGYLPLSIQSHCKGPLWPKKRPSGESLPLPDFS